MVLSSQTKFLRAGKVKDIYDLDAEHLVFHFTDRISAYDVILPSTIPMKGEVLCMWAAYWFETLGVPNHMVKVDRPNRMVVRRLEMIPVECVVRGYLYGSLYERARRGEVSVPGDIEMAAKLPAPIFDPTTKSDVKDTPITEAEILREGVMAASELEEVKEESFAIYRKMSAAAGAAGFILADLKLEFGRDSEGGIVLADSIGPDEFRLWPEQSYSVGRVQESYDKQPVRDWLTAEGYRENLEASRKMGLPIPPPPELPRSLILETSRRYVTAYERVTGRKLGQG